MIEPDFTASDREASRPERERELIREIQALNFLRKVHARAVIAADEAIVNAHRTQEDLTAQENEVKYLMENL
jgi:hypothetical protein